MDSIKETWDNLKTLPLNQRTCYNCVHHNCVHTTGTRCHKCNICTQNYYTFVLTLTYEMSVDYSFSTYPGSSWCFHE